VPPNIVFIPLNLTHFKNPFRESKKEESFVKGEGDRISELITILSLLIIHKLFTIFSLSY
jgi:hypothetical protein